MATSIIYFHYLHRTFKNVISHRVKIETIFKLKLEIANIIVGKNVIKNYKA